MRKTFIIATLALATVACQTQKSGNQSSAADSTAINADTLSSTIEEAPINNDSADAEAIALGDMTATELADEIYISLVDNNGSMIGKRCTSKDDALSVVPESFKFDEFWSDNTDIDGNGMNDLVVRYIGTLPKESEQDEESDKDIDEESEDNSRRGFILLLNKGDHYEVALQNDWCFPSENEDGGVYFAPELSATFDKTATFTYSHGRYGNWQYTFDYRNGDYELVKFERNESESFTTEYTYIVSYDIDKGTKVVKQLNNKEDFYAEDAENVKPIYETSRYTFHLTSPIRLSKIEEIK